jgi:hypothetical protein
MQDPTGVVLYSLISALHLSSYKPKTMSIHVTLYECNDRLAVGGAYVLLIMNDIITVSTRNFLLGR